MSKPRIFLDSSALIAGILSSVGAARALLVLSERSEILLFINEHVIIETERSLARKVPHALSEFRQTLKNADIKIIPNPLPREVKKNLYLIRDSQDVSILLSAMKTKADFLVTHNRKHFLNDPKVAEHSGLRVGTPGDALAWVREQLASQ